MPHDLIQGLIVWLPTLCFFISLLFYFLTGIIRGFRKSMIFLIHAAASLVVCMIIFFSLVNSKTIDTNIVSLANFGLGFAGTTIQEVLGVGADITSTKDLIVNVILNSMTEEEVFYYVIIDAGAYLMAVAELVFRLVLFILLWVVHLIILFLLTIIYHIFYPVRRKVRRFKKMYENGDVSEPYKKRRFFGGLVGVGRGIVANIFLLSFVGLLLWLVTGENKPLPDRHVGTTEEITSGNEYFDLGYDYYSSICEAADFGILAALNAVKDPNDVPYYLYICDTILQGRIEDINLNISETFYLRRELGNYIAFAKDSVALVVEYAGKDIQTILNGEGRIDILVNVLTNEEFIAEFSLIIDDLETDGIVKGVLLSVLNSFVNHIDKALGEEHVVTKLIQTVFDKEEGIKVTDLATEEDIKGLIKASITIAATAAKDLSEKETAKAAKMSEQEQEAFDIKLAINYASLFIDEIQKLSLFNDRKDVGNKLLSNIYNFCAHELVKDDVTLPTINPDSWIDELNILFDSVECILNIGVEIYDTDKNVMVDNLLTMFEGENGAEMEQNWDELVAQISKSQLLDVVFRVTVPGTTIDSLIQGMTGNPDASIPKKFSISSTETTKGELQIILECVKVLIKNDFSRVYELTSDGVVDEPDLREMFEILNKDVNPSEEIDETILDLLLESKLLRYALSSFVTYSNFGDIEIYITSSASEIVTEVVTENDQTVTKEYNIITKDELSTLFDFALNSPDFVISLLSDGELDLIGLVTSDEVVDLLKDSNLLKGIIAGVFSSLSETIDVIVLPYGYDNPEKWITDGEVDALIDAIVALKEVNTESGEPLINELMNGNVDLNTILNLEESTISEMYKSKVLKYTISGTLSNLGTDDFSIVVPGVSCELVNAKTSKGEFINIVSESEIIGIFDQIDNIVDINGDEINILYSKIFNNKAEILSSYTIQATIMNLLVSMGDDSEAFIKIPDNYIDEYNNFVNAVTFEELVNNKWFVSNNVTSDSENPIKDDELYILFEAIEALLGDDQKTVDEEGNVIVKDTFTLDSIGDSIQIKKTSIDTITSSIVLNSTLTNTVTDNLITPLSALEEGIIKKNELKNLLDSLFSVLDKGEEDSITLDDLDTIDLNTIKISKKAINEIYINSEIFMTAFSNAITNVENVVVPVETTIEIEVIDGEEIKMVNRIIDKTMVEAGIENEFNKLIECLFEFLGETNGEDEILNLSNFEDVEDFKLNSTNIPVIVQSDIFTASMSDILSTEEKLVIPEKDEEGNSVSILTDVINSTEPKYVLSNDELHSTLLTLLDMFGEENTEGVKELGLVIDLTDFVIDADVKTKILESAILSATISKYILNEGIGVVPEEDYIIKDINILNGNIMVEGFSIVDEELENFMTASIELFGEDGKLNINKISLNNFVIDNSNVGYLDDSYIINATTTNELIKVKDLVIPEQDSNGINITNSHNIINSEKQCATIIDIVSFMEEMIVIFGGSINPSNLSSFEIKLVENDDLEGILWATFSKQLINNNDILIPVESGNNIQTISVLTYDEVNGVTGSLTELVTVAETNNFKDSLIAVLSSTNELVINLEGGVKVEEMSFGEDDVNEDDGIFASNIFTATVSKSIIELDSLTVPSIVKINKEFYGNENRDTLNKDQVKALFNSLFVTTNGADIKINDFKTTNMVLPTDQTKIAEMLESLIVAATMSEEIVSKSGGSTVILDRVMTNYQYDKDSDGLLDSDEEDYISIDELQKVIYALSEGLGKTLIADLQFETVSVPDEEKISAIIESDLIRATISREVMSQEEGISVEASICTLERLYNDVSSVVVISKEELSLLIIGLNELGISSTFDNIEINIPDVITNALVLPHVADSSILRSILSDGLKENNYYLYVGLSSPVELDVYKQFNYVGVTTDTLFTKEQLLGLLS